MTDKLENESNRRRLAEIREGLLALHKTLIDSERVGYEQTFGPITTPHEFWRLLLNDPWFAWLRPLSGLISRLDETLDQNEPLTGRAASEYIAEITQLLTPSETGEGFSRHYFEALQKDPNVTWAHAEFIRLHRATR